MASIRPLSLELAKKAAETINEDPHRLQEDLDKIKQWLQKQPHLKVRLDDQWLVAFLRGCKHSLERTKEKLDSYYTLRTLLPEFFQNRHPSSPAMQTMLNTCTAFEIQRKDDPAAQTIVYCKQNYDPEINTLIDLLKYVFLGMEIFMYTNDNTTVRGGVCIIDMEGTTWRHMVPATPSLCKKFVTVIQKGYPIRPQCVHVINAPSACQTFLNLLLSFSSPKLKLRFASHKTYDELYKYVPKHLLHKELGGDAGSAAELSEKWRAKVKSMYSFFDDDEEYGSTENRRPGKPQTSENMFGIEGSFRKLTCD